MFWLLIPRTLCKQETPLPRPVRAGIDFLESSVACHPRMKTKRHDSTEMASSSYTNSANSFIYNGAICWSYSCCTWKASAATTPLSLSKLQVLTKIPRESVDERDRLILSSLLHAQDIAMIQGYSSILLQGTHD